MARVFDGEWNSDPVEEYGTWCLGSGPRNWMRMDGIESLLGLEVLLYV